MRLAWFWAAMAALVLGLVVLHSSERFWTKKLSRRLGPAAIWGTAWLGVPVHELSHLLVAKLFGHRVVSFRLFAPNPEDGTFGYVRHAYRKHSWWQQCGTWCAALAPPVVGGVLVAVLVSSAPAWHAIEFLHWRWLSDPWWVSCLRWGLILSIAMHLAPSMKDLRSAAPGIGVVLLVGSLLNGFTGAYDLPMWDGRWVLELVGTWWVITLGAHLVYGAALLVAHRFWLRLRKG